MTGIVLAAYYVSTHWVQLVIVTGGSMEPTYHSLQFLLLDRHTDEFTYGDVIAFTCDDVRGVLIKRVAALPGDAVYIRDGRLYVNGTVSEYYAEVTFEYAGLAAEEVMLSDTQYFVLGDNIAESTDSRYEEVGLVEYDSILGKVL